jgi:casein kinase 1
LLYETKLYRIL